MKTETLQFKRLVRMAAVAEELRPRLPEVAGKLLDALVEGIGSVNDLTATIYSGRARIRELRRLKKVVRSALRSELDAIWRTSRAVALGQTDLDPGRFRVRGNSDQQLLAAARAAIRYVGPLVAEFLAHAMPEKFLDRLKSRLEEFEETLAEFATSKRMIEDLERSLRRTMGDAMEGGLRLDAAVRNAFGRDGATLAAWESACALRRTRRSKKAAERVVAGSDASGKTPEGGAETPPDAASSEPSGGKRNSKAKSAAGASGKEESAKPKATSETGDGPGADPTPGGLSDPDRSPEPARASGAGKSSEGPKPRKAVSEHSEAPGAEDGFGGAGGSGTQEKVRPEAPAAAEAPAQASPVGSGA